MPKRTWVVISLIAVLAALAAAAYFTRNIWIGRLPASITGKAAAKPERKEVYTCPMHPQVTREHPGDCPICGMTLVKKEAPETGASAPTGAATRPEGTPSGAATQPEQGQISLDPRQRMLANVATTKVTSKSISQDINTVGRVALDEKGVRKISSRFGGRIERLNVNYTGQTVRKGELIMSIYSPELIATQKEYLIAKESGIRLKSADFPEISKGTEGVLDASRARMRLWGMTDAQVAELDRAGRVKETLDIYSPLSGTVMDMKVRQGDYVSEGSEVYTVADLARVWVFAEVYEYEFSKVGIGSAAEITVEAYPGKVFRGRVSFVEPTVNAESRTVRLRVELSNTGGILKPDMFVNARILSRPVRSVTVPASAILYTGMRDVAWVESRPGVFEPRDVKLGLRSGDEYQVLSGLREGDMVVTQGGFLLDSEAQLRASAGGSMPGMDMPPSPPAPLPKDEGKGSMKGMPGM